MKKIGAFLVGVGLIAGVTCAADSNTATSVNIVGFISQSNTANRLYMINSPFIGVGNSDSPRVIADIVGTNMPNGTIVFLWTGVSYASESFFAGAWSPGTNLIKRNDGFWIKSELATGLLRAGEVPSFTNTVVQLTPGLQMIGYPYPVECALTNMGLNTLVANGDIVFKWNGLSWDSASFFAGAWDTNYNFNVGDAFWYKRDSGAGVTNWVINKPY
jgi:hypothetical protein